jgi:CSLREA domain-containing protein
MQMRDHGRLARMGLVLGACAFAPSALAVKVINVDSTADEVDDDVGDSICHTASSHCTLRAAVMQAVHNNASVTDGVKIVVPAGTYMFSLPRAQGGGQLDLALPAVGNPYIEIDGAGAHATIIDANHIDRAIHVANRVAILNNLTVRNGFTNADVGALGGGIFNEGSVYLNDVIVTNNYASGSGGGVHNAGDLTINVATIASNISGDLGGGIYNGLFDGYTPNGLNMNASTVSSNSATYGGGIFSFASMVIANSTIANNGSDVDGGGIFSNGYSSGFNVNIYNTTIAGNDADQTRQLGGAGGGIFVSPVNGGAFNLYNSILALNNVSNTPQPDDCFGAISTHARNRFGSTANCTITQVSGSYALLLPNFLGALQDNGGPTPTIALPVGSNAINAGDPVNGCRDINGVQFTTDQRGFIRGAGVCDLGAYEYAATDPNDRIFGDGFETPPPPVH